VGPTAPADAVMSVNGENRMAASKLMEIQSEEHIRLRVGNTIVDLLPEGIKVHARRIDVEVLGAIDVKTRSAELLAHDAVALQGKSLSAVSEAASLVLDTEGWLDGTNVYINCKGQPPVPIEGEAPPPTGKVTFRVDPPPGFEGPFTMVVQTPTGATVEMLTDAENKVVLDGNEGEEFTLVQIRKGDTILKQLGGKES